MKRSKNKNCGDENLARTHMATSSTSSPSLASITDIEGMADKSPTTLYDLLEVRPTCKREAIVKAYQHLSKKHDPLQSQNNAKRYDRIVHAYITLSNRSSRKAYDRSIGVSKDKNGGRHYAHDTSSLFNASTVSSVSSAGGGSRHFCPTCHGMGELVHYEKLDGGLMRELRTFCVHCSGGGSWIVPCPSTVNEDSTVVEHEENSSDRSNYLNHKETSRVNHH